MTLTHLNPPTMHTNPAFSQGVIIDGGVLIVVGGQNGTDDTGQVISSDIGEQAAQAFRNVLTVLADAGVDQRHVAKLSIYLKSGGDVAAAYRSAAAVWGQHPTAITVLQVAGFARPEVHVEIEALAVVESNS